VPAFAAGARSLAAARERATTGAAAATRSTGSPRAAPIAPGAATTTARAASAAGATATRTIAAGSTAGSTPAGTAISPFAAGTATGSTARRARHRPARTGRRGSAGARTIAVPAESAGATAESTGAATRAAPAAWAATRAAPAAGSTARAAPATGSAAWAAPAAFAPRPSAAGSTAGAATRAARTTSVATRASSTAVTILASTAVAAVVTGLGAGHQVDEVIEIALLLGRGGRVLAAHDTNQTDVVGAVANDVQRLHQAGQAVALDAQLGLQLGRSQRGPRVGRSRRFGRGSGRRLALGDRGGGLGGLRLGGRLRRRLHGRLGPGRLGLGPFGRPGRLGGFRSGSLCLDGGRRLGRGLLMRLAVRRRLLRLLLRPMRAPDLRSFAKDDPGELGNGFHAVSSRGGSRKRHRRAGAGRYFVCAASSFL
jgi:hypothetical protein